MTENGLNLYIFEKKTQVIKKHLERKKVMDDYILKCNSLENDVYLEDEKRFFQCEAELLSLRENLKLSFSRPIFAWL